MEFVAEKTIKKWKNNDKSDYKEYKITSEFLLLEQSAPCRPSSQEHLPVEVLQSPALLQSSGQLNSERNIMQSFQMNSNVRKT